MSPLTSLYCLCILTNLPVKAACMCPDLVDHDGCTVRHTRVNLSLAYWGPARSSASFPVAEVMVGFQSFLNSVNSTIITSVIQVAALCAHADQCSVIFVLACVQAQAFL